VPLARLGNTGGGGGGYSVEDEAALGVTSVTRSAEEQLVESLADSELRDMSLEDLQQVLGAVRSLSGTSGVHAAAAASSGGGGGGAPAAAGGLVGGSGASGVGSKVPMGVKDVQGAEGPGGVGGVEGGGVWRQGSRDSGKGSRYMGVL
jgi:hypothetical protein